jgi:D-alanyl-D-alanine carboxypeptidase
VFGAAGAVAADAQTVALWGYELYGARFLKASSVADMTDFSDGDGYGLGTVDLAAVGNGRWNVDGVGHTGASVGYRSVLAVLTKNHVSIAILTPSEVEVLPLVQYLVKAGSLSGR